MKKFNDYNDAMLAALIIVMALTVIALIAIKGWAVMIAFPAAMGIPVIADLLATEDAKYVKK